MQINMDKEFYYKMIMYLIINSAKLKEIINIIKYKQGNLI